MANLKLKAYVVHEKGSSDYVIVHARKAAQAKAIARSNEIFENTQYVNMRAERAPAFDKTIRVDRDDAFLVYDKGKYRVAYREG